jgi:hypothetical protein
MADRVRPDGSVFSDFIEIDIGKNDVIIISLIGEI